MNQQTNYTLLLLLWPCYNQNMLYYSEIQNRMVYTEDGVSVGKLKDLIFTFEDVAKVSKLYVKSGSLHENVSVPVSDVALFGDKIVIKKGYTTEDITENEMYLGKNVVDKQIIDIEGKKVVRVNDALIQFQGQSKLYITGVDIGFLAIMRWIGLESFVTWLFRLIGVHLKAHVLSWKSIQPLELSEGKVVLNTHQDKLQHFLPEDLADYLELTNIQNTIKTLDLVDKEFASEVIAELNLNYQIALFHELGFKKTVRILELMDPDEAVDVLLQLSPQRRTRILKAFPPTLQKELKGLINVSKTRVGQYMTTEFVTVRQKDRVEDVINKIRETTHDYDFLFYVYVVNSKDELIGVFNIHELILHKPNTRVFSFMHTNVVLSYLNTPIQIVAKRMITYKLYGLPVVSSTKKILGVVLLDDIDESILEHLQ